MGCGVSSLHSPTGRIHATILSKKYADTVPATERANVDEFSRESRRGSLQVEIFISTALKITKAPKCLAAILSNDRLRRFFFAYVRDAYNDNAEMRTQFQNWKDVEGAILQYAANVERNCKFKSRKSNCAKAARLGIDIENMDVDDIEVALSTSANNNLVVIMLTRLASEFLLSKHYGQWRAGESGRIMEVMSYIHESEEDDMLYPMRGTGGIDKVEIPRLLGTSSWLFALLASMEDIPACFTLSTASPKRPGFPLIYVNKAFERMSGYDRSELIGKNCKLLQSHSSVAVSECEKGYIKNISHNLANALPVRTMLSNYKKNGEKFLNLLSMKPIFDQHGTYSYVAAIQTEVRMVQLKDGSVSKDEFRKEVVDELSVNEKLMSLLPSQIICGIDD